MINIYIKELENKEEINFINKVPKCLKKIFFEIIKKTNHIVKKNIEENKKIYLIPNINKKTICKRLLHLIEKEETKTQKVQIILSNNLKKYKDYFSNYKIVNKKELMINLIEKILREILQNEHLETQDIYILTNKYTNREIRLIRQLIDKVKSINIITKEIENYKKLEDIMQEEGNIITVSNNKKKSLKRANIIINLDFKNEDINNYNIQRNAIIINISGNEVNKLRGFEGIIIRNIKIELSEKENLFIKKNYLIESFDEIEIYQSFVNIVKSRNINILELHGNNGKIDKKELLNWEKILTN